jgi:hypothetical protein
MNTVQKIKSILDTKAALEQNINQLKRGISHVNMRKQITLWTQNGDRIDVDVPRESIIPVLDASLKSFETELDAINKQVDAIGALMGVK